MIVTKKHIARRTALRGIGATIALPLLDSMVPALTATARTAAAPIRRFGAIYVGNGMAMNVWGQPQVGPLEINSILEPAAAFKDRLLVISGLASNEAARGSDGGGHSQVQAAWLTGARARRTEGVNIEAGTSLDQIVAREFGKQTQLASIELGIEATELSGACNQGYSCAYTNTIAWRTPTTPLPMENNPRNVFERMFGDTPTTTRDARFARIVKQSSLLDSITDELADFQRTIGPADRVKVDAYLDAVRDAERRVQKAEDQVNRELPTLERPMGTPAIFGDHVRLMIDLQTLAFQTDLTRVFTLLMVRETSVRSFPEIGVADSYHPVSHHQNNPEKLAKQAKLNAYWMKEIAYLTEKLSTTAEGAGSLLDNTMVLFGAGMSDGNLHLHKNLPTVLISGRGFEIVGNRHIRYPDETPLANLQVTILEKLGLSVDKFGDSSGRLNVLTGV
jgi:hypothetical protein